MSRQLIDIETLLQQLIAEHRKLLKFIESQQAAMKSLDLNAMDRAAREQESSRLRIAALETRRRALSLQLAKTLRINGEPTIAALADLFPPRRDALLHLREELRAAATEISRRTHIAGKVAGAVLGHLNTALRLLAGAVEQAGIYTKHGTPQVSARLGVMEAVG